MKSKYSNYYKYFIVSNGYHKRYAELKKGLYLRSNQCDSSALAYFGFLESSKTIPEWDCSARLIYSQYMKAKKVKEKITDIVLSDNAYFITLTFNNETLANTSFETRRRYVARYLKEHYQTYAANVDYGGEKGREHYHAAVGVPIKDKIKKWPYGFSSKIKVGYNHKTKEDNTKAISKYITKLTAHALKVKNSPRLIYSRNSL